MSLHHRSLNRRRWARIRQAVLDAANWRCVRCRRYGNEVDHIQPPDTRALVAACAEVIREEMEAQTRSGNWTPNAPATVESREGSKPLIDTERYARAIAWKWHTGGLL